MSDDESHPHDTGNASIIRRLLDDTVAEVVQEHGYEEDQQLGNLKLAIMAASCAMAALAHCNPWEFPDNRWFVGACCFLYATGSFILQLIVTFVDQDYIFVSVPKKVGSGKMVKLGVRTEMKRFDEVYTLKLERQDKETKPESDRLIEVLSKSIGKYFDWDGYFAEKKFRRDVKKRLQAFDSKCLADAKSE